MGGVEEEGKRKSQKEKGNKSIGVRAGWARGAAAPPNFGQLSVFWAARENLGKACF